MSTYLDRAQVAIDRYFENTNIDGVTPEDKQKMACLDEMAGKIYDDPETTVEEVFGYGMDRELKFTNHSYDGYISIRCEGGNPGFTLDDYGPMILRGEEVTFGTFYAYFHPQASRIFEEVCGKPTS